MNLVGNVSEAQTLSGELSAQYGTRGKSAYEYALEGGFEGTEEEFMELCASVGVDLTDYVKNTDYAQGEKGGVVRVYESQGVGITTSGILYTRSADETKIDERTQTFQPIVPKNLDYAVMKALSDCKNHTWTDEEKASARELLGADNGYKTLVDVTLDESNSGTSKVVFELDAEEIVKMKEFIFYIQIPVSETLSAGQLGVRAYFTDETSSRYLVPMYDMSNVATTSGNILRGHSLVKIVSTSVGDFLQCIEGKLTHHEQYNSANQTLSMFSVYNKRHFVEMPVHFGVTLTNSRTFPTGTYITLEGR